MLRHFSHVQLFATLWTVARQAPLSMNFSGKNTGVGSHSLLQEIFLTQGLDLGLLHWQADSLLSEPPGKPKPHLFLVPQPIYFRISQNEISRLQASKSMLHLLKMQVSGPFFQNDQITVSEGCLCSVGSDSL